MPLASEGIDDMRGCFLVVFNQQYLHGTHQKLRTRYCPANERSLQAEERFVGRV
jgi:hypothetical protein